MLRRVHFFAERSDLVALLATVEAGAPIRYVRFGMFQAPTPQEWTSYAELPGLGEASQDSYTSLPCYLVVDRNYPVTARPIPQRRGGTLYSVEARDHPDCVTLRPGGLHSGALIYGDVSQGSNSAAARELMQRFELAMSHYERLNDVFLMGPGAGKLLDQGTRLVASVRQDSSMDFRRHEPIDLSAFRPHIEALLGELEAIASDHREVLSDPVRQALVFALTRALVEPAFEIPTGLGLKLDAANRRAQVALRTFVRHVAAVADAAGLQPSRRLLVLHDDSVRTAQRRSMRDFFGE